MLFLTAILLTTYIKVVEFVKIKTTNNLHHEVSKQGADNSPQEHSIQQKPFERNQPRISRIFAWNKKIIVEAESLFYKLDISTATAKPVLCPGRGQLIGLTRKGEEDLALCKVTNGYELFSYNNGDWRLLSVPKDTGLLETTPIFIADRNNIVLLTENFIFRKSDSGWEKINISQPSKSFRNFLGERYLLFENNLYIGHDEGEWGGGLVCLDIITGKSRMIAGQEELSGVPIKDLKMDSTGKLWIVGGIAHSGRKGVISKYSGEKLKILAYNSSNKKQFINWPFEATAFDSLSFQDQTPYLLTGSMGILKYESGKWEHLTPNWPNVSYVSCLYMLNKDTAIIGLYDAGVLIWQLNSNSFTHVNLAESFYY